MMSWRGYRVKMGPVRRRSGVVNEVPGDGGSGSGECWSLGKVLVRPSLGICGVLGGG